MEQRERFQLKLKTLSKAISGFEASLKIDISNFDNDVADVIKNGRIQKFEYSSELVWKTIKEFLSFVHSIDVKSPKQSVKEFFLLDIISNDEYETLLNMLDDRNKLSHIYKEEFFDEIHNKLDGYLSVMKKVEIILIQGD